MIGNQLRNSRFTAVSAAAIVFVFLLMGLIYNHVDAWDMPIQKAPSTPPKLQFSEDGTELPPTLMDPKNAKEALDFYFNEMFKPAVEPSTRLYRPNAAWTWKLTKDIGFPKPMGEKLCIIDLDNRPFNKSYQVFGPNIMSWTTGEDVHGLSLGIINHWLYAKIHGYKYYYVAIDTPEDRRASWKKPTIISEILKKHEACVYLDSDALFNRLNLPFEWLMNYWKIDPANNSLALAEDPDRDFNKDKFGKLNVNTGFIIAQNNPKTHEIMTAWDKCPEDGAPYPECVEFRKASPGRPTDQGGFGSYVRYSFKDDIITLNCDEANGFPLSDSGCTGLFIRHLWTGKDDWIKVDFGAQTPGPYLELFHQMYLEEKSSFYITEEELMTGSERGYKKPRPRPPAPKVPVKEPPKEAPKEDTKESPKEGTNEDTKEGAKDTTSSASKDAASVTSKDTAAAASDGVVSTSSKVIASNDVVSTSSKVIASNDAVSTSSKDVAGNDVVSTSSKDVAGNDAVNTSSKDTASNEIVSTSSKETSKSTSSTSSAASKETSQAANKEKIKADDVEAKKADS